MRIAIFSVGTQGDARPAASLGRALREAGHEVLVATSLDHRALMEAQGLRWSDLSPSYAAETERAAAMGRTPGLALLRARMREASILWAAQAREAASGAGLLLGAGLAMGAVAAAIGEANGVPAVGLGVMPLMPTRAFPPPVPPPGRARLPGRVNLELGHIVRRLAWHASFAAPVARLRRDLNLKDAGSSPSRTLFGWSPRLLAQPPDWPRTHIRVTGAWMLPGGSDEPDPALRAFVEAGERPVAIGFGSMRVPSPEGRRLGHAVAEALRISGRRAVVIRGWGGLDISGESLDTAQVVIVDQAPYGWLLPHVAAIVHHGGAGTVTAAARAGVPQIVVPFVADQSFWGWRLERLGLSPGRLSRAGLSGPLLASALDSVTPAMVARAADIGGEIAAENGTASAIATLREWGLLPDSRTLRR